MNWQDSEIVVAGFNGEGVRPIQVDHYPDGMPLIRDPGPYEVMLLRPRGLGSFAEAMALIAASEDGSPGRLIVPCFPGARQDRHNDEPGSDYLFTLGFTADMVRDQEDSLVEVVVVDPHSDVTPASLPVCRAVKPHDFLDIPAGKYAAVVAPDGGAEKRAGGVARKLGVPLIHAWKTRDVATGRISGFGVQPIPAELRGGLALVVDDICDGGGTFLGLATELRRIGLRAHLYVTHGVFSQGTEKLLEAYEGHVYATDTVIAPAPGVIRVPICERLLKGDL